uniref:Neur_chan_memb domain-containing protein n=1 Tax=Loa loa TaxID=7209 RepID=A0A1I7V885_LOALO
MDFDPEHPKWLCCCCRLVNGLMILASSEIVLSVLLLLYSIAYIAIPSNPDEQEKLLYPTLVARAIIVIFMQVFGVSVAVRPSPSINDVNWDESDDEKMHKNLVKKKHAERINSFSTSNVINVLHDDNINICILYTLSNCTMYSLHKSI